MEWVEYWLTSSIPNDLIQFLTILAYCWEVIGFLVKWLIWPVKMKSVSCRSERCSLMTLTEFGLRGIERVVFTVFFCLTFTSVLGVPDSLMTSETFSFRRSDERSIKSHPRFKRREWRGLFATSFRRVLTCFSLSGFFPMTNPFSKDFKK